MGIQSEARMNAILLNVVAKSTSPLMGHGPAKQIYTQKIIGSLLFLRIGMPYIQFDKAGRKSLWQTASLTQVSLTIGPRATGAGFRNGSWWRTPRSIGSPAGDVRRCGVFVTSGGQAGLIWVFLRPQYVILATEDNYCNFSCIS